MAAPAEDKDLALLEGDLQAPLREQIERFLETLVFSQVLGEKLSAAFHDAMFPGAKRFRPLLALVYARDLGFDPLNILPAACAIEIIHNSTLVHDDLPALDNDTERRGLPAVHFKHGEATGILVGDVMIPIAFSLVSKCESLPSACRLKLLEYLSDGYRDVCIGQQADIATLEDRGSLREVARLKTGALLAASLQIGAAAGGGISRISDLSRELGLTIGEGYQLVNDYHDRFGTPTERGRRESSDQRNNKPALFNSKQEFEELKREISERVDGLIQQIAKLNSIPTEQLRETRAMFAQIGIHSIDP